MPATRLGNVGQPRQLLSMFHLDNVIDCFYELEEIGVKKTQRYVMAGFTPVCYSWGENFVYGCLKCKYTMSF
jgi:hypothetical protein